MLISLLVLTVMMGIAFFILISVRNWIRMELKPTVGNASLNPALNVSNLGIEGNGVSGIITFTTNSSTLSSFRPEIKVNIPAAPIPYNVSVAGISINNQPSSTKMYQVLGIYPNTFVFSPYSATTNHSVHKVAYTITPA